MQKERSNYSGKAVVESEEYECSQNDDTTA